MSHGFGQLRASGHRGRDEIGILQSSFDQEVMNVLILSKQGASGLFSDFNTKKMT